jgi:hypothetical protein
MLALTRFSISPTARPTSPSGLPNERAISDGARALISTKDHLPVLAGAG